MSVSSQAVTLSKLPKTVRSDAPAGVTDARTSSQFVREESIFISANVCAMALIVLAHVGFVPWMGWPPTIVFVLFALRILMQIMELWWLRSRSAALPRKFVAFYEHASVWLNIVFAFVVAVLAREEDAHYTILMLIPLTAAAFRFSLPLVFSVVVVVCGLTLAEIAIFFQFRPPIEISEYFEGVTLVGLFVTVAIMVWMFSERLKREEGSLKLALEQLRAARDRLVAEEKLAATGRLASAIAHEIRNPVAMISSSLIMARKAETQEDVRDELFGIAAKEAARLETLTNDFLAYARTRAPERKSIDVGDLLNYVADLAKGMTSERGVALRTESASALEASLDPFLIQQALLNLLLNAIEAAGPGGTVKLGTSHADGVVQFYIENSGAPISAEARERIFEPFFTTKAAGTGLGLAIARSIVAGHDGELALECNEVDCIRFVASIPVKA